MSRRILARLEESIVLLPPNCKELQPCRSFYTPVQGFLLLVGILRHKLLWLYIGRRLLLSRSAWEEECSHFVTSSEIPMIRSSGVPSSNLTLGSFGRGPQPALAALEYQSPYCLDTWAPGGIEACLIQF